MRDERCEHCEYTYYCYDGPCVYDSADTIERSDKGYHRCAVCQYATRIQQGLVKCSFYDRAVHSSYRCEHYAEK